MVFHFNENDLLLETESKRGRPQGGIEQEMLNLQIGQGMELPEKSRSHVTKIMRELRVLGAAFFITKKHEEKEEYFNLYRLSEETYEILKNKKKK